MAKYKKKPEMETSWEKGEYKFGIDEKYETELESTETPIFEERPLPEERIVRETKIVRRTTPKMEETQIKPLKLMGEEVLGSLFDRVDFLKKRIEEITESIQTRKTLHDEMVVEIDKDIKEKEEVASRLTDIDERRNFKLDISILRKEKRNEHVQFWRDLVELKSELRELMEKFESETKIVKIFHDLGGDAI